MIEGSTLTDSDVIIARYRIEIDHIDTRICQFLAARLRISTTIQEIRRAAGGEAVDPIREAAILDRFDDDRVRAVYRAILEVSR